MSKGKIEIIETCCRRCGKSIRNIPFQRADGDRFTLAPKDASAFALVGLGAYAPAYAGQ